MPPKKKVPAKSGTEAQPAEEKQPAQESNLTTTTAPIKPEATEKKPETPKLQPKPESKK